MWTSLTIRVSLQRSQRNPVLLHHTDRRSIPSVAQRSCSSQFFFFFFFISKRSAVTYSSVETLSSWFPLQCGETSAQYSTNIDSLSWTGNAGSSSRAGARDDSGHTRVGRTVASAGSPKSSPACGYGERALEFQHHIHSRRKSRNQRE